MSGFTSSTHPIMVKLQSFYAFLDLAGTFAFAISGATAARQRRLDAFGICVVAFTVACGGGIIRDLCIGSTPPAGLSNWRYLLVTLVATGLTIGFYPFVRQLKQPVLFFDALGLGMFAITGAQKTLAFGHNAEMAVLLAVTTAVGGGVLRDVLLNRVPVILQREVYASAELVGGCIVVLGAHLRWLPADWNTVIALIVSFSIRLLALRFRWNLPVYSKDPHDP